MNSLKTLLSIASLCLVASSTLLASLNELNWENSYPNRIREDLFTVIHDGDKFIAGGSGGAIWYSVNGFDWDKGTVVGIDYLLSKTKVENIRYTGGQYFAFGTSPTSAGIVQMTSDDGINWIATSHSSAMRDTDIVYAFDTFSRMNDTLGTRSIEYGNGKLVRMASNNSIWLSSNATDWTSVDSSFANNVHKLRFLAGNFYAVVRSGEVYRSNDGEIWEQIFENSEGQLEDIAFFKGKLYLVQNGYPRIHLITSVHGIDWEYVPSFYGVSSIQTLATNESTMVAVGSLGSVLRSKDGISWNGMRSGTDSSYHYASSGSVLVGLNAHADSWYSKDGYTRYEIEFDKERYFGDLGYFNQRFIAYDYFNEELIASTDGVNWQATEGTPEQLNGSNSWYFANDRMFVVPYFARDLPVATSTDGSNWTFFDDFGIRHIYYGNDQYHASERNTFNVRSSTDGLNWVEHASTLEQSTPFHPNYALYFKNAFYASYNNRIYKSDDGFDWSRLVESDQFPYHYRGGLLSLWNEHLVFAGSNGSLGISINGSHWTHFEVGASRPVEQLMQLGDRIIFDLGWGGLVHSLEPGGGINSGSHSLEFDFEDQSIESLIDFPVYPDREFGLLLESRDLRRWRPALGVNHSNEAEARKTSLYLSLENRNGSVFYRNGYVSTTDLHGAWDATKRIEEKNSNENYVDLAIARYPAEVRIGSNRKIKFTFMSANDLSPLLTLEGTYDSFGIINARVTQSVDGDKAGIEFSGYIGVEDTAPHMLLEAIWSSENNDSTRCEISLGK